MRNRTEVADYQPFIFCSYYYLIGYNIIIHVSAGVHLARNDVDCAGYVRRSDTTTTLLSKEDLCEREH